jgi:hypothetical protein
MAACVCCGCAATALAHAALPHKTASLRLCRKIKTEKTCLLIQLYYFSLQIFSSEYTKEKNVETFSFQSRIYFS